MSYEQPEILKEQHATIGQELAQDYAEYIGDDGTPIPQQSQDQQDQQQEHKGFQSRSNRSPEEIEAQKETDSRSVYIGNVDYNTTPEELEEFFSKIGTINRVTILFDRFTGRPKGYAYVEFESQSSVDSAIGLSGQEFKDRIISVNIKRTNVPGFRRGRGRGRGGSFRGRGGDNNGYRGRGGGRGGSFRGRGGYNNGFRGRGGSRGGFRGDSDDSNQQTGDVGAELLAN
ncbi:Embryonic polyadenylate-binding protein 2 [Wickerhamomyces ciferrii]|uniref:Embryonic polyadenylate-binding protein 2 n=1 Tax=Wickerhamomyces ciferrii (strain ATCC 14091 / BCRC 22168 / CBS 111 / JCM 3599 / NBRC 0793 / NRRL Y-1031 F-60-10) TaxID=1206466 RepID=K0KF99_WICCF|nr:Embryonic polyadenylate-binding protein 2 [Wickerhamomyces ciferrii]CCH40902.1 Embryonic polyadenylate-binding protein 2 [Wickerhamomyces ciferrii]